MKRNKTITMLTAAIITVLSSCTSAEIMLVDEQDKVTFTAGELTRATGNSWDAGDQIGVTMWNAGITSAIKTYSNMRYDANTSGTSISFTQMSGDMYFTGYDNVVFTAYCPYKSGTTTTISVNTSGGTQEDILYAKSTWAYNTEGTAVGLDFKYALAKIVVKLVAGTDSPDLSTTDISIGGQSVAMSGTLDLKTGTVTSSNTTGTATVFKSTANANEYYGLLIPHTAGANVTMSIQTNGGSATISLTGQTFEAKEYYYTVTVNNGKASLKSLTITDRERVSKENTINI